jgi:hypothetical protein
MIANYLDFKLLKKTVSISQVLAAKGLSNDFKKRGDRLIGPCPIHGGDNPSAFVVSISKNLWYCFSGCQAGGDVGSNLNVVSRPENRDDVSVESNPANWPRSLLARAGPRSGPAQSESESRSNERSRWETSVGWANLPLRERTIKTPIVDGDRGQVWGRPPAGDATTSKWGLASHETAVVVQSRLGQAWPFTPRRSCS